MTKSDELRITPPDPDGQPELYAELFRVARRLREMRCKVVGLLPAGPRVAVAPVAVQLGFVLADASEGAVALIDANTLMPGLSHLVPAEARTQAKAGFVSTWLTDFFVLLTPLTTKRTGLDLEMIEKRLREECEYYVHVLVDLTGFEHVGEHFGTFDFVNGMLVVGHPGATSERELLRLASEIPAACNLGVLLVG
ncbi:MAG: hypothetical protein MUF54_08610 [Polyangiaceae bacterium]|jgi:Mrp family chromosome partitioning ATPase|nr:hypothetical protein [Polyangiaceae bacterium]